MSKHIKKAKERSADLLKKLGFEAEITVVENDGVVCVDYQISDPAILIGKGGEGLLALEHILRLLVNKDIGETGERKNIALDISGYRSSKIEGVKTMANDIAKAVIASGVADRLQPMPSYERRIIHLVCRDIEGVETASDGEGMERRVVVKPKNG